MNGFRAGKPHVICAGYKLGVVSTRQSLFNISNWIPRFIRVSSQTLFSLTMTFCQSRSVILDHFVSTELLQCPSKRKRTVFSARRSKKSDTSSVCDFFRRCSGGGCGGGTSTGRGGMSTPGCPSGSCFTSSSVNVTSSSSAPIPNKFSQGPYTLFIINQSLPGKSVAVNTQDGVNATPVGYIGADFDFVDLLQLSHSKSCAGLLQLNNSE